MFLNTEQAHHWFLEWNQFTASLLHVELASQVVWCIALLQWKTSLKNISIPTLNSRDCCKVVDKVSRSLLVYFLLLLVEHHETLQNEVQTIYLLL